MTEFYINQKVKSKFLTYHKEMFIGRFTKGCTDVEVGGIPFTEFYMNECEMKRGNKSIQSLNFDFHLNIRKISFCHKYLCIHILSCQGAIVVMIVW